MGMTTCSVLRLLLLCLVTSVLLQWLFTYLPQPVRRMLSGHFYKHHERVIIDVNLVGPFHNPTETYRYYSMPFCQTHSTMAEEHRIAKEQDVELSDELYEPSKGPFPYDTRRRQGALPLALTWGESLIGYRRETTPYEAHFRVNSEWRLLCTKELRPSLRDVRRQSRHHGIILRGTSVGIIQCQQQNHFFFIFRAPSHYILHQIAEIHLNSNGPVMTNDEGIPFVKSLGRTWRAQAPSVNCCDSRSPLDFS